MIPRAGDSLASPQTVCEGTTAVGTPQWHTTAQPIGYTDAVTRMQAWSAAVADGTGPERVWLLQHPAMYTAGTSSQPQHLLDPQRLPVVRTGRGGAFTYHGPGQRIVYVMLDVRHRFRGDVRAFVEALQNWIIATLSDVGVRGQGRDGEIGVWVADATNSRAAGRKIASLGVRIRRGVSMHGIAINVAPDLEAFSGIIACGGAGDQPTSLNDLGIRAGMADIDRALQATFEATMRARGDNAA